jgi:hypothetical protein
LDVVATAAKRFETSHEAPCLRFTLDEEAKTALRQRLRTSIMPALRESSTASPDLAVRSSCSSCVT